jgi:hypothetical protein
MSSYEIMFPDNNIQVTCKIICVRLYSDLFLIYLKSSIHDMDLSYIYYQLCNQENKNLLLIPAMNAYHFSK